MEDLLAFRRMVTPLIIQGTFIIATVLCIVFGIFIMWGGGIRILLGLLLMLFGPFLVRIWCEGTILLFRINRNPTEIRRTTMPQEQSEASTALDPEQ